MARFEKRITVDVPVARAYGEWTRFENFPRFMEGVESVTRTDDGLLHWKASIGGQTEEWDAAITELKPNECVAWNSTEGARNAGNVSFHPNGPDQTRIDLAIEYEPDGVVESLGEALGLVERRIERDLERFKRYVEDEPGD